MELRNLMLRYRAIHNLTQADFAKLGGFSRELIVRAENGKKISEINKLKIELIISGEKATI